MARYLIETHRAGSAGMRAGGAKEVRCGTCTPCGCRRTSYPFEARTAAAVEAVCRAAQIPFLRVVEVSEVD